MDKRYRVLHKDHEGWHHNPDGIFPPLIDADHEHNEWAHVGHSRDVTGKEFKELTKTDTHPKGISHKEFVNSLIHEHDKDNGKNINPPKNHDHIVSHPLVQNFLNHQRDYGSYPVDYQSIKNLGVFHANDKDHIVARDSGFDDDTAEAYRKARLKKMGDRTRMLLRKFIQS